MATFLMFGKYSAQGFKEMSPAAHPKGRGPDQKTGGRVKAMYALLGETDLLLVVTLPGVEAAMQASLALGKMTGIPFTTRPAVSVEEFDKLVAGA